MRFADPLARLIAFVAVGVLTAGCATVRDIVEPPAPVPKPTAESAKPQAAAPAAATPSAPAPKKEEAPPIDPAVARAFDAARRALAAGRTAEAERGFSALTKSNPELSGPHANLALIHRQAGRHAEAIAEFEKAAQLSPRRAELHNQLGITYRMAGQFAKARAAYEKAIEVDPNYALAWLNLGILEDLYLWDRQRALALYERYLALAPSGDDNVKKWVSDLRNRIPQKSAVAQKEQK
jgi:tetratricopeptide (TPR) repeat protein